MVLAPDSRGLKKALALLEYVGLVKRTIREKENLLHLALLFIVLGKNHRSILVVLVLARLGGAHSGFDKITMVLACCIINPLSG